MKQDNCALGRNFVDLCQHHAIPILLCAVLGIAFLFRVWGINFGLPDLFKTDEFAEVHRALKLGVGEYDFERTGKGGYFYLLFVLYGIYYVMLLLTDQISGKEDFLIRYFQDPSQLWLIGRFSSAVIGTLSVYLTYVLGRKLYGAKVGILAGVFLTVSTIHVARSNYIAVDVPLVALILASLICLTPADQQLSRRQTILGAILAGLAITTKLSALPIILAVGVAHVLSRENSSLQKGLSILRDLAIVGIVIAITEPGYLFNFTSILYARLQAYTHLGGMGYSLYVSKGPPLVFYAENLVKNFGLVLAGVSLLGIATFFTNRRAMVSGAFCAAYLLVILFSRNEFLIYDRYLLPSIPLLAIGAAVLCTRSNLWRYRTLVTVGLLLALVQPVMVVIDRNRYFAKTNTRTLARRWIERCVPDGSRILIEGNEVAPSALTVQLKMNAAALDQALIALHDGKPIPPKKAWYYKLQQRALSQLPTYHLVLLGSSHTAYGPYEPIRERYQLEYVVMREDRLRPFENGSDAQRFPAVADFYRSFLAARSTGALETVKVFSPDTETAGPLIEVLSVKKPYNTNPLLCTN